MSTEGGEATTGGGAKRYYVVRAGGSEKGPYTLAQLAASELEGVLGQATQVRAEGEEQARPLDEVLGKGLVVEQKAPRRADPPRRKEGRARGAVDMDNVYAPPGDDDPVESERPALPGDEGNYWLGFALGFIGGCIALILTSNAKPKTRQGVITGFLVGLGVGILAQILQHATGPGP
jgi:hypothetical protein